MWVGGVCRLAGADRSNRKNQRWYLLVVVSTDLTSSSVAPLLPWNAMMGGLLLLSFIKEGETKVEVGRACVCGCFKSRGIWWESGGNKCR